MQLMRASRGEIDFDESLARALNLNGILGCAAESSIRTPVECATRVKEISSGIERELVAAYRVRKCELGVSRSRVS